jgi:hypothetical protein
MHRLRWITWGLRGSPQENGPLTDQNSDTHATSDELNVLLKAYELERLEDIQALNVRLVFITTTLGLMSVLGFLIVHGSLPAWIIAVAPLPPIPFMAYVAPYTMIDVLRGSLIDAYEGELRQLPTPRRRLPPRRVWALEPRPGLVLMAGAADHHRFRGRSCPLYIGFVVVSCHRAFPEYPVLAVMVTSFAAGSSVFVVTVFALALSPERLVKRYGRDFTVGHPGA